MSHIRKHLLPLIKRLPLISLVFHYYTRKKRATSYYKNKRKQIELWARKKTEYSNYYYDLTEVNELHLVSLLSAITNTNFDVVNSYIKEIRENKELKFLIENSWANDPSMRDARIGYGRRIGWYALIRLTKPRLVVETGVHHGVGACVIASALTKNISEGHSGDYLGTDINVNAGILFNHYKEKVGKILYGDSIDSLNKLNREIDIFINDSDHSAIYEYDEYQSIKNRLSKSGIILGDNSHSTNSLLNFSIENGRKFLFFKEEPRNHWYPGGGIGISLPSFPIY